MFPDDDKDCKAHPDEKGIETSPVALAAPPSGYCKAHPDEKGIETSLPTNDSNWWRNCKAHPDEKGIETELGSRDGKTNTRHCKAHPDEKGIETFVKLFRSFYINNCIAKHIPTKRELKQYTPIPGGLKARGLKSKSRRKGN